MIQFCTISCLFLDQTLPPVWMTSHTCERWNTGGISFHLRCEFSLSALSSQHQSTIGRVLAWPQPAFLTDRCNVIHLMHLLWKRTRPYLILCSSWSHEQKAHVGCTTLERNLCFVCSLCQKHMPLSRAGGQREEERHDAVNASESIGITVTDASESVVTTMVARDASLGV